MNGDVILMEGGSPLHLNKPVYFAKTMNATQEELRPAERNILVQPF